MAKQLAVSVRTIHRALGTLENSGFPLEQVTAGRESFWSLPRGARHVGVPFSSSEALALLWAERCASPGLRDTVLAHPLRSAALKVRGSLPPEAAERVLTLADRELGLLSPHHDYAKRDFEIATLRRAIQNRVTLQMRYQSLGQKPRLRALDPYAFVHHLGALYVVGYCHRRSSVRTFLVDRIRSATLTKKEFCAPADFAADQYFSGAFGVFRGRATTVRLRFDRQVADWAGERVWHESQQLRSLVDGRIELTLRVAPTPDLVTTILSFGRHVEVLAPRSLAVSVAKEWFAAASRGRNLVRSRGTDLGPDLTRVDRRLVGESSEASEPKRRKRHG